MGLEYIFLGVVQGLTEFLPVSSSGHLAILQRIFNMTSEAVAIAVVLHFGTALALAVYFYKDILKGLGDRRLLLFIIIVTLITGAIGVPGKKFFENLFDSPRAVAAAWMITGALLISTRRRQKGNKAVAGFADSVILGVAQGLAIAPGISRSGITIVTLLFRKIAPEASFRLSFLAAIPAIVGAAILEAKDIGLVMHLHFPELAAGFIASFLTGLFALGLLRRVMRKEKLYYFGYYCMIIAVLTLIFVK